MTAHLPMSSVWPLVGRGDEFARILGCTVDSGRGVVIAGPAGVGKTRLARESVDTIESHGYRALRVAGTQATARLPLGAFAALLPDLAPDLNRGDMLRHVARSVGDAGGGAPIALLVDDAHLLDDTSAALTYQLASSGQLLVIATIRSRETAPEQIGSLWRDGLMERVDLAPLGLAEVTSLLESVLDGLVETVTARTLSARSGGNLVFLRELVIEALRTAVLAEEYGMWHLRGDLPPSDRLIELVDYRLRALSTADARNGLEVLAVAERLGLGLLKRLTSEAAIHELEETGLVRVATAGSSSCATLAHPLYGEVVRASLPTGRVRSLARSLADVVEEFGGVGSPDDLLRLGSWRLDGGGESEPEPALMLAAAHRARALHDFRLAERLARAAAEPGASFEASLLFGQVLSLRGCPEDAEQIFASMEASCVTDAQRGPLAVARLDNLCYGLGHVDKALMVAGEAEGAIDDERWHCEIAAYRAASLDAQGDIASALEVAAPLVKHGRGKAAVWASFMTAWGAARTGNVSEAMAVAAQAYDSHSAVLAAGGSLPWGLRTHVCVRGFALLFGGQVTEAETLLLGEYQAAVDDGAAEDQWVTAGTLAAIYAVQGKVVTAERFGRECVSLSSDHGRVIIMRIGLISLAEALALAGKVDDAEAALADLMPSRTPEVGFLGCQLLRSRAWAAVAQGKVNEGKQLLRQAIDGAAASGDIVWESAALHDVARLGEASRVEGRILELAQHIEGPLGATRAEHASALAKSDAGRLEGASEAFERMGALLFAAEASADAAAVHRRKGRPRDANRAQLRAARISDLCEGATTPSLSTTPETRAILSSRELEIARAAAIGNSNKEIARQLCLSVRTVENKLQDTYGKLGVSRRDQLCLAMESLPLPEHSSGRPGRHGPSGI